MPLDFDVIIEADIALLSKTRKPPNVTHGTPVSQKFNKDRGDPGFNP